MEYDGIVANFAFPEGAKEKYRAALLPCVPRIGEKIQSSTPQSGVYRVKNVAYEINDLSAEDLPRVTILVELEGLDEISSV